MKTIEHYNMTKLCRNKKTAKRQKANKKAKQSRKQNRRKHGNN